MDVHAEITAALQRKGMTLEDLWKLHNDPCRLGLHHSADALEEGDIPIPPPPTITLLTPAPVAHPALASLDTIARTKPIQFISYAPLIDQGPFSASDLDSIDFRRMPGTTEDGRQQKRIHLLNAPCQSGKTPSVVFLSMKVMSLDMGCWVLLLLNINSNHAVEELLEKVEHLYRLMDVSDRVDVVQDSTLLSTGSQRDLRKALARLKSGAPSVWICKATESVLGKLVEHVPPEAWARCVVIMDEPHCFFSHRDSASATLPTKSEVTLRHIICGAGRGPEDTCMEVLDFVLTDATDADLPDLFRAWGFPAETRHRIQADMGKLERAGYVGMSQFQLFRDEGGLSMTQTMDASQRYGKDVGRTMPIKCGKARADHPDVDVVVSGLEFAGRVTRADFAPVTRAFFEDALDFLDAQGASCRFLLEMTTLLKGEDTFNSVFHHAHAIARLFPNAVAFAESGEGCAHVSADGGRVMYATHRIAHETLCAVGMEYHGRPKYVVSNLAVKGSMRYSFAGAPVTHMVLAFHRDTGTNLLSRAQGAGRAAGFVRDDLRACGGLRVQVLCTQEQFEDMTVGVYTYADEAHALFPRHRDSGAQFQGDVHRNYQIGHYANPEAIRARKRSASQVDHHLQRSVDCGRGNTTVEAMHSSTCTPFLVVGPTPCSIHDETSNGIVVRSAGTHDEEIRRLLPTTQITGRVMFFSATPAQHQQCVSAMATPRTTFANTDIGRAIQREQARLLPGVLIKMAFLKPGQVRESQHARFNKENPAHYGRNGKKRPQDSWQAVVSYDVAQQRAVAVLRSVQFADLTLPCLHYKLSGMSTSEIRADTYLVQAVAS